MRRAVQGVMAPGPQLLSEEQLRRTWSLIDILTMLKRRGNLPPPTAELILRKFDGLSLLALDNLSMLIEYTIAEQGRRLCPDQVCAMAHAVRVFPEDTASEIAHAHACESVASADGVKRASHEGSHLLRLGLEQLAMARKKGLPLVPIATDVRAPPSSLVPTRPRSSLPNCRPRACKQHPVPGHRHSPRLPQPGRSVEAGSQSSGQ